jgi:hypothetical protein
MMEKEISAEDEMLFFNLNTPQDLLRSERLSTSLTTPNERIL